jgi:hypothetical protein
MRFSKQLLMWVPLGTLVAVLAAVGSAGAAGRQTVRCVGTADYCGATVSIAGGATNRVVTVALTDTTLKLVGVRAVPTSSVTRFKITKASFRLGGSQYRFTLNAQRGNPRRSRIVLLFAAGNPGVGTPLLGGGWHTANAIFSVGVGRAVTLTFGDTNCTSDETSTTFTTKGNNESHQFGFYARSSGSCFLDLSWAKFRVSIRDADKKLIGSGTVFFGQQYAFEGYVTNCNYEPWVGASCTKASGDDVKISK